jgi:glycogen synthase
MIPILIRFDGRYKELAKTATVGTVHNCFSWAYPPDRFEKLSGLAQAKNPELYSSRQGLLHGFQMHFIKGIQYADMVNTVSPTFLQELLTPEIGRGFSAFFKCLLGPVHTNVTILG